MSKIFGIGLSRTGTVSLTDALKILGYTAIHSPEPHWFPELKKVIDQYNAFTDFQIAIHYKKLDKLYPNSKFILTTRPIEGWLRSYETYLLVYFNAGKDLRGYFFGSEEFNDELYRKGFLKHWMDVNGYFKDRSDDFLIMDFTAGHGWERLCKFLGKEIPKRIVSWNAFVTYTPEFPHQNRNHEANKRLYNKLNRKNKWT